MADISSCKYDVSLTVGPSQREYKRERRQMLDLMRKQILPQEDNNMEKIQVEYSASVMVPAGWRGVTITAVAEKISDKRCRVIEVLDIDGLGSTGYGSRTGANRQKFHIGGIAKREEGKIKNLSSCTIKEG